MAARVRLGDLLIKAGMITQGQLDDVLALQAKDGRRLGTLLVEAGLVSETQVTQILSQQLSVPWVSLYHIDFSRQLLNLVPREVAERHCLVPIFVRKVRGVGECLYVAMDDPTNDAAHQDVRDASGLPVRAMIAPPSDIKNAIRVYYGGGEAGEEPAPAEVRSAPEPVEEAAAPAPAEPQRPPEPEVAEPQRPPEPEVAEPQRPPEPEVAEPQRPPEPEPPAPPSEAPLPPRDEAMPVPRGGPRMVELTLLDGSTVRLPARPRGAAAAVAEETPPRTGDDQLTARDLVAALRAVSHGADATEILGESPRWEAMLAALLSVLLKKHLIADWEFVEEYRKI